LKHRDLEKQLTLAKEAGNIDEIVRALYALGEHHQSRGEGVIALSYFERILAWRSEELRAEALVSALTRHAASSRNVGDEQTLALAPDALGHLASRYRILRELATGGAGTVYLGLDLQLNRQVAIKLLHRLPSSDGQLAGSFPEAELVAGLCHVGILRIFDLDAKRGVLVTEYMAGGSLRDRLFEHPTLPGSTLLGLARSLLKTLQIIHEAGVIHGDLKPANVLFRNPGDPFDRAVLADFGIACRLSTQEATAAPGGGGTKGFQAPELRMGEPQSPSADLYSLGKLLEFALPPDRSPDPLVPPSPTPKPAPSHDPSLAASAPLATLLQQLLDPDPETRLQDAAAALRLLD